MARTTAPSLTATELNAIIDRQPPGMAKLARSVLSRMRARLPGAVEMVYDKKNSPPLDRRAKRRILLQQGRTSRRS